MNKLSLSKQSATLDFDSIVSCCDDKSVLFDYFADQVDIQIQNTLVTELMTKYAAVSKQLEAQNKMLDKYNNQLEELVQAKIKEISESQIATIHALVRSAETRDDDTGDHIERTSAYCRLLAEKLMEAGMYKDLVDSEYASNIEKASPLHDIGKVGIRDNILLKPARLTTEECAIMKTHVIIGYETLASVEEVYHENAFLKIGMEICRYHHEKWDGSGYMLGLSGKAIPLSARIMAISDVYDALRSKRTYKEAFSHEKTVGIMAKGRESHFDPELTDIFMDCNKLFCEIYDRLSTDTYSATPSISKRPSR